MSAVDEARALLAAERAGRTAAIDALTASVASDSDPRAAMVATEPYAKAASALLDAAPRLLVRLCDEIDALRAADVAHEQRHALSERGDGYADRVIAELRAERDALREYYEATMDARAVGVTLTPPYGLTPPAVTPEVQRAAAARLRAALDALAAKGEG